MAYPYWPLLLQLYKKILDLFKTSNSVRLALQVHLFLLMRETQGGFYFNFVLFTFASQLYIYFLGPNSLLGY